MAEIVAVLDETLLDAWGNFALLLVPAAFAGAGAMALCAFLRLAGFSGKSASAQTAQWIRTGLKCILLYFLLASGILFRFHGRLHDLFLSTSGLPFDAQLAILAFLAFLLVLALVLAYLLFPIRFWLSCVRQSARRDKVEVSQGLVWRWKETVTWKWRERRLLIPASFGAFVALVLALALDGEGSLILFLLAVVFSPEQVRPSLRLEPNHDRFRRWMLSAVWVYYWDTVCIGWRCGWSGLLFITLPALLMPVGTLFFRSASLLPLPPLDLYRGSRSPRDAGTIPTFCDEIFDFVDLLRRSRNREARREWYEQHRTALRCLVTYALGTNYPYHVVVDERITERTEGTRTWLEARERLIQRLEGDVFAEFLAGPGIVLTGCDHLVVVCTSTDIRGARGPGLVFTNAYETPTHVIDLRVQLRAFHVDAWTKDGIGIRVVTFVPFQMSTGDARPQLGEGFPYRASDVYKAVTAETMQVCLAQTPEDNTKCEWYDLPQLVGEPIVRDIISHYEFDELYAPFELYEDLRKHPRARIADELRQRLDTELPKFGIKRVGGGISDLVPMDDDVIEKRIEAWRANWARRIAIQRAEGQSVRISRVEQARAQAQVEIILDIAKRIERIRDEAPPVHTDAILQYFVEALESLLQRSALRDFLPGDVDSIMRRLQRRVGGR